ncbi:hypothetical protein Hanom_Chr05g00422821 [Helianthus anomalus]
MKQKGLTSNRLVVAESEIKHRRRSLLSSPESSSESNPPSPEVSKRSPDH